MFPNQVFDSKSDNPILRYPTFSGSTTSKKKFRFFLEMKILSGVESEKVGYLRIELSDIESKT
jgi:hypothetical protein